MSARTPLLQLHALFRPLKIGRVISPSANTECASFVIVYCQAFGSVYSPRTIIDLLFLLTMACFSNSNIAFFFVCFIIHKCATKLYGLQTRRFFLFSQPEPQSTLLFYICVFFFISIPFAFYCVEIFETLSSSSLLARFSIISYRYFSAFFFVLKTILLAVINYCHRKTNQQKNTNSVGKCEKGDRSRRLPQKKCVCAIERERDRESKWTEKDEPMHEL